VQQIAGLRKHLTRLHGQASSRREDLESSLSRLTEFTNSVQSTTDKIDGLVESLASKLSQPIADDVQAIQREQQLFEVSCALNSMQYCHTGLYCEQYCPTVTRLMG